jgi:hypothetical protein
MSGRFLPPHAEEDEEEAALLLNRLVQVVWHSLEYICL